MLLEKIAHNVAKSRTQQHAMTMQLAKQLTAYQNRCNHAAASSGHTCNTYRRASKIEHPPRTIFNTYEASFLDDGNCARAIDVQNIIKNENTLRPAVRSKISSKFIFASCVCYSDRAYYELCVLIEDTGRRLPLQLQCSYQGQQGDIALLKNEFYSFRAQIDQHHPVDPGTSYHGGR